MSGRRGSWPLLVTGAVVFLLAFALQRGRSPFLWIERNAASGRTLAAQHDLPLAEVLALWELLGSDIAATDLATAVASYAARRTAAGAPLAAMLATGADAATATAIEAALRAADDPDQAWRQFAVTAAALPGHRFLEVRRRFAERAAACD